MSVSPVEDGGRGEGGEGEVRAEFRERGFLSGDVGSAVVGGMLVVLFRGWC